MRNRLPLETELEKRLPEVGINLSKRIYREQLEEFAREDDEIDEMLGLGNLRNQYGKVVHGESKLKTPEERLLVFLFGSEKLSETQRELSHDRNLIFKRTGIRIPWNFTYEFSKENEETKNCEWVNIYYNGDWIFYGGNGYLDGRTVAESCIIEGKDHPPFVCEGAKNLESLDGKLWNPKIIADNIIELIKKGKDRL
ncbi:MAG: hypothetical protein KKC19_02620 [Nanoarchaeota archaeon]|nr:hypothetical protein [Nanoarchaeota archaeon]